MTGLREVVENALPDHVMRLGPERDAPQSHLILPSPLSPLGAISFPVDPDQIDALTDTATALIEEHEAWGAALVTAWICRDHDTAREQPCRAIAVCELASPFEFGRSNRAFIARLTWEAREPAGPPRTMELRHVAPSQINRRDPIASIYYPLLARLIRQQANSKL